MQKYILGLLGIVVFSLQAVSSEFVASPDTSTVSVEVKASPPHKFTCDLEEYNSSVSLNPANDKIERAVFTFRLSDLDTHNQKRNRKMHDWMDIGKHDVISWTLASVENVEGRMIAHGELQMHGVKHPVDVPYELVVDGEHATIRGEATFNYMDFELPKIRLFIFTVVPELRVHFTLNGVLAAGK